MPNLKTKANLMVKIAYNKRIDAAIISNAEKQFELLGIKTESREQEDEVSNSVWWALTPLIGIWIAKPFLDGFLSELGKDSAGLFKKILREAYLKLRNSPIRAYDRSDLEKMDNGANPMSVGHALPVIGIGLQIEDAVKCRWEYVVFCHLNFQRIKFKKPLNKCKVICQA
jgi:hypothetical protein